MRPVALSDSDALFRIDSDPVANTINPAGCYPDMTDASTASPAIGLRHALRWIQNQLLIIARHAYPVAPFPFRAVKRLICPVKRSLEIVTGIQFIRCHLCQTKTCSERDLTPLKINHLIGKTDSNAFGHLFGIIRLRKRHHHDKLFTAQTGDNIISPYQSR